VLNAAAHVAAPASHSVMNVPSTCRVSTAEVSGCVDPVETRSGQLTDTILGVCLQLRRNQHTQNVWWPQRASALTWRERSSIFGSPIPATALYPATRAHRHAVAMGGIDPAGRRDGDQVVAEVHEDVHAVPRIEPVRLCETVRRARA
jgi:hypothetical protein